MIQFIRNRLQSVLRFRDNPSGTSAIEFALILPVMIVLYFGCVEVSEAVSTNRKVAAVASSIGDLAAQSADLSNREIDSIFDAATAIIAPFDADPLKMVITGVRVDADGRAEVAWSESRNASSYARGATFNLPNRLKTPNTFHVVSEVKYTYTPLVKSFVTGPFTLGETFYLRPRRSSEITRS